MTTTHLSSKGQVIIPKAVREARGWEPGIEFVVEERPEGILLRPVRTGRATTVDDLVGCVGYRGPRRSLEDMDQAIAREARKRR